jgi:hypothetical protein
MLALQSNLQSSSLNLSEIAHIMGSYAKPWLTGIRIPAEANACSLTEAATRMRQFLAKGNGSQIAGLVDSPSDLLEKGPKRVRGKYETEYEG